jgi:hypothetical protein
MIQRPHGYSSWPREKQNAWYAKQTAPNGHDERAPKKPPSCVIGARTFMRSYVPISYTLGGILPSGYLRLDAEANGVFQLVCFDTFQAGFAAADAGAFNDNEAVLNYVSRLRPLTTLPGSPSVPSSQGYLGSALIRSLASICPACFRART